MTTYVDLQARIGIPKIKRHRRMQSQGLTQCVIERETLHQWQAYLGFIEAIKLSKVLLEHCAIALGVIQAP